MNKSKDFTGDLAELEASIDVSDVLTALNQSRKAAPAQPPSTVKPNPESAPTALRKTPARAVAERTVRGPQKVPSKPAPTYSKVTTQLTPEIKERLRQAARLQGAYGREPSTEYGIVNQAVEEWLKRHGFGRRWKPGEPGEAPIDDAPDDAVSGR